MNHKRKYLNVIVGILSILSGLFLSFHSEAYGQTSISGVINTVSARIDAVYGEVDTDVDSVHVNSIAGFAVGDTVMVHMAVGATFYTSGANIGLMSSTNNIGKYAIFILQDINIAENLLILNSTLPGFFPLITGEYGQIVKVPTYKRAIIDGTLTCNKFDPVLGTGGILVLMVKQGLVFNADINVDGKGFPGADPDVPPYSGTCSTLNPVKYSNLYFSSSDADYSALKGFSVAFTTNDTTRGRGSIINGGGGGNGLYSGGGGGANGGSGGNGGNESASCGGAIMGGLGGRAFSGSLFYFNDGSNRISMGGGGGTSTQTLPTRKATSGGAGGGIVVIVCDSLVGNRNIFACGQTVTDSSTAGAGGGGGGGVIILHVNKYSNPPKLWVSGGHGGKVATTAPEASGPGGGGGSGVIWYNGLILGPAFDIAIGKNGTFNTNAYGALSGSNKAPVNNLKIPIRGFLFNYIPEADTICKNNPPKTINAAPPAGGTGSFTYKWMQSYDSLLWVDADSIRTQVTYTPPSDADITIFYKRTVFDGFIHDTSNIVKMFVLPVLINNNIKPDNDTIVCSNLNAGTLYTSLSMSGGNGSYQYTWEKSPDNIFSNPETVGGTAHYLTPVFTADTWYRRKVISSACKSTSNHIKITVLPAITNNTIDSAQEICTTRTPDLLTGGVPGGGDGNLYTYKWQTRSVATWTDLVTVPGYQPPALTASRDYRRIVISGPSNTCKDTSEILTVTVMPVITNNLVDPIEQNILCYGLNGDTLTATTRPDLSGGNGNFNYYWQKNGINASGGDDSTGFNPGVLTETSTFRRIVTSGTNNDSLQRCSSISNTRTISVLESVTNNILSSPKSVWCEGKTPEDIMGTIPQNGDGTYEYSWQRRLPASNWEVTDDVNQNLNTPVITSTVDYRRIVKSGLNNTCKDTSIFYGLTMQDSIMNNHINDNNTVFVCFDEDSSLLATTPGSTLTGGDEVIYNYIWMQSSLPDGTFSNATQPGYTDSIYLTESIQTSRYYKRRVISGDCENISPAVKIEPLPLPKLTSLSADLDEICFSKLYSIISSSIQSGSLPYIITFTDGQGFTDSQTFTSGSGSFEPQISNPALDPGYIDYNYNVVSIEDGKGCYANSDSLQTYSAALRVYTTPMPSLIGDDFIESCSSSLQISVNPSIGVSSWHLRNSYGVTAENTNSPTVNLIANYAGDDSASVSLAYVENIANCPSDTIFSEVVLYNNPDSIISLYKVVENNNYTVSDTVVIFISDNQKFAANEIISGIPRWSIASGAGEISDSTSLTTTISRLMQDDPSFLEYSISNGNCPVSKRTLRIERKELMVYDGFSPNNDQINDELWAIGLANEEVDFKFQIFSSSGSFIREITRKDITETDLANNSVVLWDGTTDLGGAGNFIPDGTYYYVLIVKYHGENFNKRGNVIVKR